jgi:hypothetical protein
MNHFNAIERIAWFAMWRLAQCSTAVYRRGETEITVNAVKCTPQPEGLTFGGFQLYTDSIIFEIEKSNMTSIIQPKEGDIIVYEGKEYPISSPNGNPCWLEVGAYNVTIKVHTRRLR